jgi:hypothetical protein
MSTNPLNDISRVYLEQVVESAVPGKPAERLGAVTAIPKSEQDAARERTLAKAAAIRAKKGIKEEERKVGGGVKKGGGYERGYEAMKREIEKLDKGQEPATAKRYREMRKEALDPVGQEDSDIDNDGKKNTKSDKYLLNRRKVRGSAITKKSVKEGYSNWREDLSEIVEVVSKDKNDEKITEKTVKNKIKINPNIGEAVENLGGTLLEMVEVDEVDYIVESVYDELLSEGYEENDIEEAIEYALTEAKVTFGHDTPKGTEKKRGSLLAVAKQKLSGAKKAAKQAIATGARKVAKGALGVARKIEGGDKTPSSAHTKTRSASTYRGAGTGTKERVSSGSYTPPTKKKSKPTEDPWEGSYSKSSEVKTSKPKPTAKSKTTEDPWEGSYSKSSEVKTSKPKPTAKSKTTKVSSGTTKASKPKPKGKGKGNSNLDDLIASVRSEQVRIDEKTLTSAETKKKEELVKSMKPKASDFEKRYPGRGKEVMYATATKMAKKMTEQAMEIQPKAQDPKQQDQQQKKIAQQKDRGRQQEVQILNRKLQALRSAPKGSDSSVTV